MHKNSRYHLITVLLFFSICFCIFIPIFSIDGYHFYGDLFTRLDIPEYFSDKLFYTWDWMDNSPTYEHVDQLFYSLPLFLFFQILKIEENLFSQIVLFFSMFLAGIFSYFSISKFLNITFPQEKKFLIWIGSLIGGFVYMVNPWVFKRINHFDFFFGFYVLAPIVLILFFNILHNLEKNWLKKSILLSIILMLSMAAPVQWIYHIILLLISSIFFSLIWIRQNKIKKVLLNIKILGFLSILILLMSSFWIFPLYKMLSTRDPSEYSTKDIDPFSFAPEPFLSRYAFPKNVFNLEGHWLDEENIQIINKENNDLRILGYILPIFAFSALFIGKNEKTKKYVLLFSIIALIGLYLSMGTNAPFSKMFYDSITQVMLLIPVFRNFGFIFRDPNDWIAWLALSFSFLSSMSIINIIKKIRKTTHNKFLYLLPFFLIIAFSSLATYPWIQVFQSILEPVNIPYEIKSIHSWLSKEAGEFNVLPLPNSLRTEARIWSGTHYRMDNVFLRSSPKSLVPKKDVVYPYLNDIIEDKSTNQFGKLLGVLNVKYVIFTQDLKYTPFYWWKHPWGEDFETNNKATQINRDTKDFLEKQIDLKEIKVEGFISIYENLEWLPKIYIAPLFFSHINITQFYSIDVNETLNNLFTVEKESTVSYVKMNPTKYIAKVNATEPFMLSFAESYDPVWIAYVNGEKVNSIPLLGVINGFSINITGELTITIEYEAQSWFYYGSAISITVLIGSTVYIIWDWKKKKRIQ